MNSAPIQGFRLSEESTTESSTSVSGDSESERPASADIVGPNGIIIKPNGPWETEEEFLAACELDPVIKGRYTDADPAFRDDVERVTPPIVENYQPRNYGRGRSYGGRGGRQQNYDRYDHYNRGNYHRNHNQGGGNYNQHYQGGRGGGSRSYRDDYRRQSDYSDDRNWRDNRGEGSRSHKRRTDHSQSFDKNSQFYARPIGGGKRRRDSSDHEDGGTV